MDLTLHNPACRHVRARQLQRARQMKREGILALRGYTPPPGNDVQRLWRLRGWLPSNRQVVTIAVEIPVAA